MLTRLKVSGFKNLVDTEIRFGPFTCIAGANAVGKSNLFDAIQFLSLLADQPLMDAARTIRAESGRSGNIRSLFQRAGDNYAHEMAFEVEMMIPREGLDELGQKAEATITFVRYRIAIGYKTDETLPLSGTLELLKEDLEPINLGEASKRLKFPHAVASWRRSVLKGRRTSPFISTRNEEGNRVIKLSQDGSGGRPKSMLAANLPRTVLSTVNAIESPTALIVRREMQSWRVLQLEPKSLREPDRFTTAPGLQADGSHLPATLFFLARSENTSMRDLLSGNCIIYDRVSSRLSELTDDVCHVTVDRDEQREWLTLQVREGGGTVYPARSLSDGILRFLALAVLALDPGATGLFCIEEPENSIHPGRIPAMLSLLQDMACDSSCPVGPDNPLRQVIVNTHSPAFVSQVPDDSLLVAEIQETVADDGRFKCATFRWLDGTWRCDAEPGKQPVSRASLLSYLNPVLTEDEWERRREEGDRPARKRRIVDRPDMQLPLPFWRTGK